MAPRTRVQVDPPSSLRSMLDQRSGCAGAGVRRHGQRDTLGGVLQDCREGGRRRRHDVDAEDQGRPRAPLGGVEVAAAADVGGVGAVRQAVRRRLGNGLRRGREPVDVVERRREALRAPDAGRGLRVEPACAVLRAREDLELPGDLAPGRRAAVVLPGLDQGREGGRDLRVGGRGHGRGRRDRERRGRPCAVVDVGPEVVDRRAVGVGLGVAVVHADGEDGEESRPRAGRACRLAGAGGRGEGVGARPRPGADDGPGHGRRDLVLRLARAGDAHGKGDELGRPRGRLLEPCAGDDRGDIVAGRHGGSREDEARHRGLVRLAADVGGVTLVAHGGHGVPAGAGHGDALVVRRLPGGADPCAGHRLPPAEFGGEAPEGLVDLGIKLARRDVPAAVSGERDLDSARGDVDHGGGPAGAGAYGDKAGRGRGARGEGLRGPGDHAGRPGDALGETFADAGADAGEDLRRGVDPEDLLGGGGEPADQALELVGDPVPGGADPVDEALHDALSDRVEHPQVPDEGPLDLAGDALEEARPGR